MCEHAAWRWGLVGERPLLSEEHGRIKAMARQRGELVPVAEALAGQCGPVKAIRDASPQTRRGFHRGRSGAPACQRPAKRTPIWASWRELMALCSLPRTNPGNRLLYKRVNGPFTLIHAVRRAGVQTSLRSPSALADGVDFDGGRAAPKAGC